MVPLIPKAGLILSTVILCSCGPSADSSMQGRGGNPPAQSAPAERSGEGIAMEIEAAVRSGTGLAELFSGAVPAHRESIVAAAVSSAEGPEIIRNAIMDNESGVRKAAVSAAMQSFSEFKLDDVLLTALQDQDVSVRNLAVEYVKMIGPAARETIYKEAIASGAHADVKKVCMQDLTRSGGKSACDTLLNKAAELPPELQEEAVKNFNILIPGSPSSFAEAASWWAANKGSYNDTLAKTAF